MSAMVAQLLVPRPLRVRTGEAKAERGEDRRERVEARNTSL